jgi:hypothetical protein
MSMQEPLLDALRQHGPMTARQATQALYSCAFSCDIDAKANHVSHVLRKMARQGLVYTTTALRPTGHRGPKTIILWHLMEEDAAVLNACDSSMRVL